MRKKILAILTITCLSLGVFSLVFTPFTSPQSPLYSATFDKIATELVVTVQAAETECEKDKCVGVSWCTNTDKEWGCDLGELECTTYACGL